LAQGVPKQDTTKEAKDKATITQPPNREKRSSQIKGSSSSAGKTHTAA
jgi:hypothetical protein